MFIGGGTFTEIPGLYDDIIITIVQSYTGNVSYNQELEIITPVQVTAQTAGYYYLCLS